MSNVNAKSEVNLLSDDELNGEELDAVGGGTCPTWIIEHAVVTRNRLELYWVRQGCPV